MGGIEGVSSSDCSRKPRGDCGGVKVGPFDVYGWLEVKHFYQVVNKNVIFSRVNTVVDHPPVIGVSGDWTVLEIFCRVMKLDPGEEETGS